MNDNITLRFSPQTDFFLSYNYTQQLRFFPRDVSKENAKFVLPHHLIYNIEVIHQKNVLPRSMSILLLEFHDMCSLHLISYPH